ncbi:MAG: 2-phospho-L-lactate transferase [Acidimicrobiales bacterium]
MSEDEPTFAVLAGGVGAARLLAGMVRAVPPENVTAIVNVADDVELHGLSISPDIDTVVYTVAGAIDEERGWGLRDETWQAMEALDRYGVETWFRLGDRDLATHLYRTQRRRAGVPLSQVTADMAKAWGLQMRVLPVTDDRLRTMVTLAAVPTVDHDVAADVDPMAPRPGPLVVSFQEYFVQRQHSVPVAAVRFDGDAYCAPAPGVVDAITTASKVVIAPSNPIVSIEPILSVPGVHDAVSGRRKDVVAISPLVGGKALKGPADRMLQELGHEPSVVGIARLYSRLATTLVIDEADKSLADAVEETGLRCIVTNTIMQDPDVAAKLCATLLREG